MRPPTRPTRSNASPLIQRETAEASAALRRAARAARAACRARRREPAAVGDEQRARPRSGRSCCAGSPAGRATRAAVRLRAGAACSPAPGRCSTSCPPPAGSLGAAAAEATRAGRGRSRSSAAALGMPSLNEADPSDSLLAIAVPLMFRHMFGDVGQGSPTAAAGRLVPRASPDRAPADDPAGRRPPRSGRLFGSVLRPARSCCPRSGCTRWTHR